MFEFPDVLNLSGMLPNSQGPRLRVACRRYMLQSLKQLLHPGIEGGQHPRLLPELRRQGRHAGGAAGYARMGVRGPARGRRGRKGIGQGCQPCFEEHRRALVFECLVRLLGERRRHLAGVGERALEADALLLPATPRLHEGPHVARQKLVRLLDGVVHSLDCLPPLLDRGRPRHCHPHRAQEPAGGECGRHIHFRARGRAQQAKGATRRRLRDAESAAAAVLFSAQLLALPGGVQEELASFCARRCGPTKRGSRTSKPPTALKAQD
mmetsp:Transcript_43929/g.140782  ORF Transcript_43929/g.140782 Transcript_43929/m.140782 type:complete len:266 (+) Transcript_43929:1131-1928(+)